jgi:NADP-dependent 3-hydroxy acid dehydrogenase YdfG
MSSRRIGERRIESNDLLQFAQASGDWNPIHTDPIAARRLLAGSVVAHGMSTALWMLERHLATGGRVPSRLTANFPRPLTPGDLAVLARDDEEDGTQRLALLLEGEEVTAMFLHVEGAQRITGMPQQSTTQRSEAASNSFEQLKQASGMLEVNGIATRDQAAYPEVFDQLGPRAVAGLMAVSRLVGMHCPGLHSLISSVQLQFEPASEGDYLEWRVIRHSVPHAPLRIAFKGSGIDGHVDAFVRPQPVAQAAFTSIQGSVVAGEFAGQVALVIGGSRGLGEVLAKLIAAGGGDVIITHREGRADAQRVANEITAATGRCQITRFDSEHARRDIDEILSTIARPTHVYYFAAPRIGRAKTKVFSASTLRSFMQVMVEGFGQVAAALAVGNVAVKLFYPSTVFLDEMPRDQAEYIAAKAAGEALCAHLNRHAKDLDVRCLRLPKLLTDQSLGLLSRNASDPVPAMLDILRAMNTVQKTKEPE